MSTITLPVPPKVRLLYLFCAILTQISKGMPKIGLMCDDSDKDCFNSCFAQKSQLNAFNPKTKGSQG